MFHRPRPILIVAVDDNPALSGLANVAKLILRVTYVDHNVVDEVVGPAHHACWEGVNLVCKTFGEINCIGVFAN